MSRQVRIIKVRILPPGPQSRSATFWSAFYPFAGPQVRSPHFTPGLMSQGVTFMSTTLGKKE